MGRRHSLGSRSSRGKGQEKLFRGPALSARHESLMSWDGEAKRSNSFLWELRTGLKVQNRSPRRICGGTKCDPDLLEGIAWKKRATRSFFVITANVEHRASVMCTQFFPEMAHPYPSLPFLLNKIVSTENKNLFKCSLAIARVFWD